MADKLVTCKVCGKLKKVKAKGLCGFCYDKSVAPVVECKRCGKLRRIKSKGYCAPCAETIRIQTSSKTTNRVRAYHKEYRKRPESIEKERLRGIERSKTSTYRDQCTRSGFLLRLSKYGLTEEFYISECNKGCQICGSKERLHIDHNHTTGKYRGILCGKCNQGIGLLNDNAEQLQKAAIYLQNTN